MSKEVDEEVEVVGSPVVGASVVPEELVTPVLLLFPASVAVSLAVGPGQAASRK